MVDASGAPDRAVTIAAVASVALGAALVTGVGLFCHAKIETRLQAYSENELGSLHALVVSAMEHRLTDTNDVAIGVFNQMIARRNLGYPGKVWTVWSPQVAGFMARTAPQEAAKIPQDAMDTAVLRSGRPAGRFVDGGYRYSLPIVLGVTRGAEQEACHTCHQQNMGLHDGDVIAVFSSLLPTAHEFGALRGLVTEMAAASLLGAVAVALAVGIIADRKERRRHEFDTQLGRFNAVLENMLQGVLLCEASGTVLAVNRRFCEIVSLPAGAVKPGMSYTELTHLLISSGTMGAKEVDDIRRSRRELVERGLSETFVWKLMDGRSFAVAHRPVKDGWLTTYEDITERCAAHARVEHLARHDVLTNLANRALFSENLDEAILRTRRGGLFALHLLDLDRFKAVNDTLGHPAGDRLLQAVAARLLVGLRETDTFARLGGDEFAILQAPIRAPEEATGLAQRLIGLIRAPFEIDGHPISVGLSVGIGIAPQDGQDGEQLLKCVDMALYRAKADGRGVYRLFDAEMDASHQARSVWADELRQALNSGQLELFYQPLVEMRTGKVSGYEAILCWRHPTRGVVQASHFVPLAEALGLIEPIGEWVLRTACAAAATWPDGAKVTVSLSAAHFRSGGLTAAIVGSLREAGLPPQRLELGIGDTVMLQDNEAAWGTLQMLRDIGIAIAMHDSGAGHSTLSHLRRFPFDRIKIAQSYVRDLGEREDGIAFVRAVAALGRELGIAVTAEGVETRQQFDALEQAGCSEAQGCVIGHAVPGDMVPGLPPTMSFIKDGPLPSGNPDAGAAMCRSA